MSTDTRTDLIWGVTDDVLARYLTSAGWDATAEQRSAIEKSLCSILDDQLGDALYAACEDFIDEWEGEPAKCACGEELDENGEHDGGYGAWCG